MRTTSVPRWNTRASAVESVLADSTVTCLVVAAGASVGEESVRHLTARSVPPTRIVRVNGTQVGDGALEQALAESKVGWRFVVVGTEAEVGRIRTRVMASGAVDAEISVLATEEPDIDTPRLRDVFCAHCHAVSVTEAAVDGVVTCTSCAADLTVYYHYSRRHGAYLGYRADSEDLI